MFLFDVDLNKGIILNPLTFISPFKMHSESRHWNLVFYETKPDNFILLSVRGIDWIPSRLWFGSVLIFHVFLNYVSPYSFFYFAVCACGHDGSHLCQVVYLTERSNSNKTNAAYKRHVSFNTQVSFYFPFLFSISK